MSDKIKIEWEAEDGYAGGSRPHTITLTLHELADCRTQEELEEYVDESVNDAFRERCYAVWKREQLDGVLDQLDALRREAEPTP